MIKNDIAPGVSLVEVPEAGLTILCGCPENSVKMLIAGGFIQKKEEKGVVYETGPNVVLLSDMPVQGGRFSNLAEFPVLQMLYMQGMGIPGHPGNTGNRPLLVGLREQVAAQAEYIYIGNYGLPTERDLLEAGLPSKVASERMRMKLAFAFGSIKDTEELLDLKILDKDAIELRNEVFLRRVGLNRYEFLYRKETVIVDMNLPAGTQYPAPYKLPRRPLRRADFAVTHLGEGDGWDPERPCMGSLIEANGSLYLVDAGPNIADSLDALGIGVSDLRGVFQTHAHDDHFVGLTALLASEKRPILFATPPVRASIMRKFRALAGMDEIAFDQFFDFLPLREGEWNQLDGLEVMPVFSPHPLETDILFFRVRIPGGYKSFAHLADLTSFSVLDKMTTADPEKPGISAALAAEAKRAYLVPADVKKIDIGGGMIHGEALDFLNDDSGEILLSHTSRSLGPSELAIGRRPGFGEQSVLIPAPSAHRAPVRKPVPQEIPQVVQERVALLATSPIFAPPLSLAALQAIALSATIRHATAGVRFKTSDGLLVVSSGVVHIRSGNLLLEKLGQGGSFGEESLLYRTAPLLSGLAATNCELLFVPEDLILDKPLLLWRLRERFDHKLVALRSNFPLEWIPAYSVRIKKLDEQHKEEFALIDATVRFYRNRPDVPEPLPIVDELIVFASEHFQTENELMEKHGFPHFRDHRDEHQRLEETLENLRKRMDEVEAAEIVNFLKDWILRHTLLMDRQYIDYLTSKGVR